MSYFIIIVTSLLIGWVLNAIGMILPWLFGPILAVVLLRKYTSLDYPWPKWLGNVALYILGAQIGVSFTKEILGDIAGDFLGIVFLSVMIILCAVLISRIFKKITDCTTETALLASIPGALSQMIIMAEENKRANLLIVTLTQTSRLLFVIMIVPFISNVMLNGHTTGNIHKAAGLFEALNVQQILCLIVMIAIAIVILKKIHFPVPDLLGPTFAILAWNLTTGLNFSVPYPMISIAQILFGIRIGLQIYDLSYQINKRLFVGIFVQNVLLISCAIGLSMILNIFTDHQFNDIFLSAAPGGMAQIVIVALETGANVAMISSYHIFRIFLILLVISPLMAWYLRRRVVDTD